MDGGIAYDNPHHRLRPCRLVRRPTRVGWKEARIAMFKTRREKVLFAALGLALLCVVGRELLHAHTVERLARINCEAVVRVAVEQLRR